METERDYGKEIDDLKKSVEEILSIVKKENPHTDHVNVKSERLDKRIRERMFSHEDSRLNEIADEFTGSYIDTPGGRITSIGTYSSGGRQSSWISEHKNVDELFTIIEDGTAEKVLKCIGSTSRLRLLLAILKKPMRVNQLVEECGYNSTGQIYHHLQPLINADLVTESSDDRGAYIIQPHRVQGIIMILSGISDLVDKRYTAGDWEWEN